VPEVEYQYEIVIENRVSALLLLLLFLLLLDNQHSLELGYHADDQVQRQRTTAGNS